MVALTIWHLKRMKKSGHEKNYFLSLKSSPSGILAYRVWMTTLLGEGGSWRIILFIIFMHRFVNLDASRHRNFFAWILPITFCQVVSRTVFRPMGGCPRAQQYAVSRLKVQYCRTLHHEILPSGKISWRGGVRLASRWILPYTLWGNVIIVWCQPPPL